MKEKEDIINEKETVAKLSKNSGSGSVKIIEHLKKKMNEEKKNIGRSKISPQRKKKA